MLQLIVALRMFGDRFVDREEGGVVIEYGIVVAVIALGFVFVGVALVDSVSGWFGRIAEAVGALVPAAAPDA